MGRAFELLRSIFAMPFEKLRTLLKKSHEETAEANSVSGDVEVETLPKPEAEESGSNKVVINQSSEGIVIVPNNLVIGERRAMENTDESMDFRYIGKVQNGKDKRDVLTHDNYPFVLIPQIGTSILGCNAFEGIISGVSEPRLFDALKKLTEIEKEIEVIQSVSLPIKRRNYGYKPDIAILWKSMGIAIDVEIDEPYDIKSREPIHCADDEKDYIRNAYFLENGWFVIRIAEEQVIKNVDDVCGYVFSVISVFAKDKRFARDCSINPVKRWSKEEAQKMAEDGFREKYLELPFEIKDSKSDQTSEGGYIAPQNFGFKKPTIEIIDNRYDELSDKIKKVAENHTYIRIKRLEDGYEYITTKDLITQSAIGITFKDVVEEKEFFLPYANIDSYVGLDNIRIEKQDDKDWGSFIYDSVVHCRPIHFIYRKGYGGVPTERTVIHLVPFIRYGSGPEKYLETHTVIEWLDDVPHGMYKRICNIKSLTKFTGYCCYRKDVRTFDPYNIVEGYAYNCYKPRVKYGTKDVLEVLDKGDGRLAEIIYSHFTEEEKNNYANIANNGHALVIQGKYEEALTFYSSIPKEKVIFDNVTWHQALCEDIETFCRNETYGAKFDHVKKLLCDNEEENIHNG